MQIVRIQDYALTQFEHDPVPRVPDLVLFEKLGYERPRKIRELIERHLKAGNLRNTLKYRTLEFRPKWGEIPERGRPAECLYHLDERDAAFIICKCDTPTAYAILHEILDVFEAWRHSQLPTTEAAFQAALQPVLQEIRALQQRVEALAPAPAPPPALPAPQTVGERARMARADARLAVLERWWAFQAAASPVRQGDKRQAFITALRAGTVELPAGLYQRVSRRSLIYWEQAYRQHGITGLLPHRAREPFSRCSVPPEMQRYLTEVWARSPHAMYRQLYQALQTAPQFAEQPLPSYTAVARFMTAWKAHNPRVAFRQIDPKQARVSTGGAPYL